MLLSSDPTVLDDSVPNIVLYLCILNESNDHIYEPNQVFSKLLGKDSDLKYEVISQMWISATLQVAQ